MMRTARNAIRRDRRSMATVAGRPAAAAQEIAVGAVVGAGSIVLKAALNAVLGGDTGFIVLFAGALAGAWFGGLRGGLAATATAAILNLLVFADPPGSLAPTGLLVGRTVLYVLGGMLVTSLIHTLRTSRDRLAASLVDLGAMAA